MASQRPSQPFPPAADAWFRGGAAVFCFGAGLLILGLSLYEWNEGYVRQEVTVRQPILFSHRHHAGDLGIDCRYCHQTVERSAGAGMPTTTTCLSCHRHLFRDSPMLEPLWQSVANDEPIRWQRVHDLKDFVFFNHAAHIQNGVSCVECHGEVSRMVTAVQAAPLSMNWCLECHRDPEPRLTTSEAVVAGTRSEARPPAKAGTGTTSFLSVYGIEPARLTDCTTCHR